ncbi:hypothetical protein KDA_42760 [Dictyobacter alpinus]|uniref:DUF676 domain-containing protein n=1 Tax=Dictyobacter alpinus TaxID=2014873 RepID=A0A402BBW4_9CHLR|nr:hypothetical protein [Dictyobacter alpinus]GCE28792.1 hypothetical protein KDA_42760 [Dictyobacter alpinus]
MRFFSFLGGRLAIVRTGFLLFALGTLLFLLLTPASPAVAQEKTPAARQPRANVTGPRQVHVKEKGTPLFVPHAAYSQTSVVFVHGLNAGDGLFGSAPNGSEGMPDCQTYWSDAANFLASRWGGDFRQLSYYSDEVQSDGSACASNGNERNSISHYSADLHDSLYRAHCASLGNTNDGTNNESLDHVSCLLAWYLFYNFGQRGWSEVLVGHSMGGLIIRRTMQLVQEHAMPWLPPTLGSVTDAITFDTPHNGAIGAPLACGNCVQGQQIGWNSRFIRDLGANAQHPNSGTTTTDWTIIGSHCDYLIGNSALMMSANHKVWYDSSSNGTCYNHGGAIHDPSLLMDGNASYCDTADPLSHDDCNFDDHNNQGSGWYYTENGYPHGLQEMDYALASFDW